MVPLAAAILLIFSRMRVRTTAALILVTTMVLGAQQLPRLAFSDSRLKLLHRVDAEAVSGVYANSVSADVIIGLDGRVESVTVLEGHAAHRASATAALKQYRFAPVVVDGKPSRVIITLSVHVPDTFQDQTLSARPSQSAATTVEARRDIVLAADCGRAIRGQTGAEAAVRTCRAALDAANRLPPSASVERRSAHSHLAEALMLAKQWRDAIAEYTAALGIDTHSEADDFNAAEYLGMMARAYSNLGDLRAADRAAASAVSKVESSLAAHPDARQVHEEMLRALLVVHAGVKRQQGDVTGAVTLERRAGAIGRAK